MGYDRRVRHLASSALGSEAVVVSAVALLMRQGLAEREDARSMVLVVPKVVSVAQWSLLSKGSV